MNFPAGRWAAAKKMSLLALIVVVGLASIVSATPDLSRVSQLLEYGYLWIGARSLPMAFYQFREVLDLEPTNEEANLVLGIIYQVNGDDRKALETWTETEKLSSPIAAALSGDLLYQQGKFEEAKAAYERVLLDSPSSMKALFGLGLIAHGKGDYAVAINHLTKVVELSEGSYDYEMPQAYYYLGLAYVGMEDIEAAVEQLKRATLLKPKNAVMNLALAQAYEARGETAEAVHAYEYALQLSPGLKAAEEGLRRLDKR